MLIASQKALAQVHPTVRLKTNALIKLLAANGLYFAAFMGLRTIEEQDALYAKGRTTPGNRVTNARGGQSWHNFGLAVDLVEDGDPDKVGVQWDWSNTADYLRIGDFAKMVGLDWGGFWKSLKDYPHVELTMGLTLNEANLLYSHGGLPTVWAEIDKRIA
jgi:peptidoglycan L-alanyl-D-glutamate endopeptidase CwlK